MFPGPPMYPNKTEVQLNKLKRASDLFFILGGWVGRGEG